MQRVVRTGRHHNGTPVHFDERYLVGCLPDLVARWLAAIQSGVALRCPAEGSAAIAVLAQRWEWAWRGRVARSSWHMFLLTGVGTTLLQETLRAAACRRAPM